jgi:hypothetical protein
MQICKFYQDVYNGKAWKTINKNASRSLNITKNMFSNIKTLFQSGPKKRH